MTNSKAILVLGMHRSGTSALAGVLSMLGVEAGHKLLPPQAGVNPKGFWEQSEVVAIHDALLESLGSTGLDSKPLPELWWRDPVVADFRARLLEELRYQFDHAPLWMIKDPRLCRLLPLWLDFFGDLKVSPCFVIALRHPEEVARSLLKRDGISEPESCLLWLAHMLEAERMTRGQPRVLVAYDSLLGDWRKMAAKIEHAFGLHWPTPPGQAAGEIDSFLDPALRHHVDAGNLPDHPVCRLAAEAYQVLSDTPDAALLLNELWRKTVEMEQLLAPWSRPLSHLRRQSTLLESQNAMLEKELTRVKGTVSWRVTGPLRAIWNLSRRLAKTLNSVL